MNETTKPSKLCGRPDCVVCEGDGWVCEDHPDLPWDSYHQANCGAGMPCRCSPAHPDNWSPEERQKIREIEEVARFRVETTRSRGKSK